MGVTADPSRTRPPAHEPPALPDALLDFVVGGAVESPPAVLERLLRDGVILKLPPPSATGS